MPEVTFLWGGWAPIVRILLIASTGYLTLLVLLRVSGQRTLSQMTPFDFVIAVTIGSAFGRVLTAQEVAVAEVVVTFLGLIALQWLVAWLRSRVPALDRALTGEPWLLYHDGSFVGRAMRRHRITEGDVLTAVREKGLGSLAEAYAVVLEPDGRFAVITPAQLGDGSAIRPLTPR